VHPGVVYRSIYYGATLVRSEMSVQVEESSVVHILVLGSTWVVFDGVDEIIDISRRRKFIRNLSDRGGGHGTADVRFALSSLPS
jgi:hypothetical protein